MSYQAVALGDAEADSSPTKSTFSIKVEQFRLIAYLSFWGMCLFATICSAITVFPGMSCVIDGVDKTGAECTDLKATFGFNNICATWDYAPACQLTALVYPIFEYSLLLYVILDYQQIKNDMLNGIFPADKAKMMKVMLWIKIVLIAWFRMIFICKVTDDAITIGTITIPAIVAHTLGFWGLQLGLVLIAFENVLYLTYRKQGMWNFTPEFTVKLGNIYLVCLFVLTLLKIIWAGSIFSTGSPIIPNSLAGIFDRSWMLLAAVMPLFFSYNGMQKDPPMVITIVNAEKRK